MTGDQHKRRVRAGTVVVTETLVATYSELVRERSRTVYLDPDAPTFTEAQAIGRSKNGGLIIPMEAGR